MRPSFALLAVCACSTPVAWAQTQTPAVSPATPSVTTQDEAKSLPVVPAPLAGVTFTEPGQDATRLATKDGPFRGETQDGTPPVRSREAMREERRLQGEARVRDMLAGFGITSSETQNAIIAYVAQEEVARGTLRDLTRKLLIGLRRDTPPERMREVLNNYKKAINSDKERRAQAQTILDAKIGYTLDARLESLLWLSGILGEGQSQNSFMFLGRGGNRDGGRDGGRGNGTEGGPPGMPQRPRGGDGFKPRGYNGPQQGSIVGTVEKKEVSWLDLRDGTGAIERYFPVYKPELNGLDTRGLNLIAQTTVGQRVRIDWFWLESRRIVSLTPISTPPGVTMTPLAPVQSTPPGQVTPSVQAAAPLQVTPLTPTPEN